MAGYLIGWKVTGFERILGFVDHGTLKFWPVQLRPGPLHLSMQENIQKGMHSTVLL